MNEIYQGHQISIEEKEFMLELEDTLKIPIPYFESEKIR